MTTPSKRYDFLSKSPPSGSDSGNDTFAWFFADDAEGSHTDRDRCTDKILGKVDMRVCLAILRFGAVDESGSLTSLGGFSGSLSMASCNLA